MNALVELAPGSWHWDHELILDLNQNFKHKNCTTQFFSDVPTT